VVISFTVRFTSGRPYLGFTSDVGQAHFTLTNKAQTYNNTANLDEGYRLRVKASGASLGNLLQVQYGGTFVTPNDTGFQQQWTGTTTQRRIYADLGGTAQYDSQYNTDRVQLMLLRM